MATILTDEEREELKAKIKLVKVLGRGYIKPDVNPQKHTEGTNALSSNRTGVVCDTKIYMPYITALLDDIFSILEIKKTTI